MRLAGDSIRRGDRTAVPARAAKLRQSATERQLAIGNSTRRVAIVGAIIPFSLRRTSMGSSTRFILRAGVSLTLAACSTPSSTDANGGDATSDVIAVADAMDVPEDLQPFPTSNCVYDPVPATANATGTVTAGDVQAGAAEAPLELPVGTALGAFTARAQFEGSVSKVDDRVVEQSGGFHPSVGIETQPRVRAIAITAGGETVVIVKADLALAADGIPFGIAEGLGPEFAGKVVFLTSHTHSQFAQYTPDTRLGVGLSVFRRGNFDRIVSTAVSVARQALASRVPARIGFAHEGNFDPMDLVSHDRRAENDDLPNGQHRKDHDLYVMRVDTAAGEPIAMMAVFGVHGTTNDADNNLASTDTPGAIERALEESFDRRVVVIHAQGAAGDVSPSGTGGIDCTGMRFCYNFARAETVGRYARDQIMPVYDRAATGARTQVELEMLTRSIPLGTDWRTFQVRDGGLSYAPFGRRERADGVVFDDAGHVVSPIDEFNAPVGAALCGDDHAALLAAGQMPGTEMILPYRSCLRIDSAVRFLQPLVQVQFESPYPVCAATRTTVSALRIGDFMMITLPGEPLNILVDHVRDTSPFPADHTIVLGYSQGHIGYMLTPEDWLRAGYEPTINMWGPLEGEYVADHAVALARLAATPMREDGAMGGTDRYHTPEHDQSLTGTPPVPAPDAAPMAGSVPGTIPPTVYARNQPMLTSAQPPATVHRLETARFVWIGEDPMAGTPHVTLQRETSPGVFEDVARRSGRPVRDQDFLLTWTPDPLRRNGTDPRTHYWVAEWQAVTPEGTAGFDDVTDRAGLALGRYRFHVQGTGYMVDSNAMDVVAGSLEATMTVSGTMVTLDVGYHAADGWRLLDLQAPSNQHVPLRTGMVGVELTLSNGMTRSFTAVAVTNDGHVTVDAGADAAMVASARVTDRFGNVGTATR
jgi:neutral ceramidase